MDSKRTYAEVSDVSPEQKNVVIAYVSSRVSDFNNVSNCALI